MIPLVQISLDFTTLEAALPVAEAAVRAGVDWLEVGTPLALGEGARAVRVLRERFPQHPIVADIKCMDGGYAEAALMIDAGATHVVVMALAHPATVTEAVRAARERGGAVMADIMLCPDKPAAARQMQELGADIIVLHTGYDERGATPGLSPLDDLDAVRAAVSIPIQAVGGLSEDQAAGLPARGAGIVVISLSAAIARPASPEALVETISAFVRKVKG
jgi:3-hexulose-6-phosphate synthase/6-phospho-3-hexuloisomerase